MKLWVAFAAAALAMPADAAVRYTATVLQTPEGLNMQAFGLNNAGEIVGGVQGQSYQAYYRSATGEYQALGGFGGNRSTATSINNKGVLAGMGRTGATSDSSIPFIGSAGGIAAIPLPAGLSGAIVNDIGDDGTVVGILRETQASGSRRDVSFRWREATGFEFLRSADMFSMYVSGVNGSGTAVGAHFESGFVWNVDGSVTLLDKPVDVAAGGLNISSAADINDQGLIAGGLFWDDTSGRTRKEIGVWSADGRLLRTASLADNAGPGVNAINNRGDIVGDAYLFEGFPDGTVKEDEYAIVWLSDVGLVDLNSLVDLPATKLIGAFDINDHGQIIAWGFRDGLRMDVLLTPNAVPEPASWALMIAGFAGIGLAARRRAGAAAFA